MTMSEGGEMVCPLCAEEMDLTDQQLKPCKCGYEICVWCWHHIVDMAEKEGTDGRCPACRTPYDKERIVRMATNCERLISGINSEKRIKSHKAKTKATAENRKQLGTVRVIQRNLVYIIGLPANLCDESLLESREYFGQYGVILKVSISRPASTTSQPTSTSNTFSVYINYTKEEEAVRCIQAVHNYILDGKPLRASFGTTKYCHAWLRNMTCSNPDCLYLHDIGSQEDSFTKDEIISAYSRRVPKIIPSSSQRRAGSILPPPADELSSNGSSTSKHSMKNASNQIVIGQAKNSNSSIGRPNVLPAAGPWGLRPSNIQSCSQSHMQQNVESNRHSSSFSAVSAGIKEMTSAWNDDAQIPEIEGKSVFIGNDMPLAELHLPNDDMLSDHQSSLAGLTNFSFQVGTCHPTVSAWDDDPIAISTLAEESYDSQAIVKPKILSPRFSVLDTKQQEALGFPSDVAVVEINQTTAPCPSSPGPRVSVTDMASSSSATWENMNAAIGNSVETYDNHSVPSETNGSTPYNANVNQDMQNANSVVSLIDIEKNSEQKHSLPSPSLKGLLKSPVSKLPPLGECLGESISMPSHVVGTSSNAYPSRKPGSHFESEQLACQSREKIIDGPSMDFSDTRQRLADGLNHRSCSPQLDHPINKSTGEPSCSLNGLALTANFVSCRESAGHTKQIGGQQSIELVHKLAVEHENKSSNINKPTSTSDSCSSSSKDRLVHLDRFNQIERADECSSVQTRESNIISDIFSLDFDPWDDSLSITNNFSKLLGEKDGNEGSGILASPLNTQNSSQSRFSFARQENQDSSITSSISAIGHMGKAAPLKSPYGDFFPDDFRGHVSLGNQTTNNNVTVTSDRPSGLQRTKVSAPPGFSLPSRAAPPGFAVQDRRDQKCDTTPDNHLVQNSPVRNHHQLHLTEHLGDVEFIDPAILAVGKGLMPVENSNPTFGLDFPFAPQFSSSECDPRLQLLMQQSVSSHHSMNFPDHFGNNFLPNNDSYMATRLLAQNQSILSPLAQLSHQQSRSSALSSNHWNSLSNMQTTTAMGMPDYLQSQRFGLNNYYSGKGEEKFHTPGTGGIYSKPFGF